MPEPRAHHVFVLVTGEAADDLEALRRRWDPAMADQIPAHVTLAYPEEAPDLALLRARLLAAAARVPPFPLRLRQVVAHADTPSRGVYHLVDDPVGVWSWLREFLLAPPFAPLEVVAHATIAHPRTSTSLREAWHDLAGRDPDVEFRVADLALAAPDERGELTLERVPLAEPAPPPG